MENASHTTSSWPVQGRSMAASDVRGECRYWGRPHPAALARRVLANERAIVSSKREEGMETSENAALVEQACRSPAVKVAINCPVWTIGGSLSRKLSLSIQHREVWLDQGSAAGAKQPATRGIKGNVTYHTGAF